MSLFFIIDSSQLPSALLYHGHGYYPHFTDGETEAIQGFKISEMCSTDKTIPLIKF